MFNTIRALLSFKLTASGSVSPHVLKMKGHLEHLDKLGLKIEQQLADDIILQSLPEAYDGFIMNFNIHSMDKKFSELHGMLKRTSRVTPKMF